MQHLLGAAASGEAFFVRAATHTGVVGLLAAFAAGYAVYGGLLLAATVALKWALVGRMQAGRHKCAAVTRTRFQPCRQIAMLLILGVWAVACVCSREVLSEYCAFEEI